MKPLAFICFALQEEICLNRCFVTDVVCALASGCTVFNAFIIAVNFERDWTYEGLPKNVTFCNMAETAYHYQAKDVRLLEHKMRVSSST